jgi:RimJ/RimL family protein N-acetyltransferase
MLVSCVIRLLPMNKVGTATMIPVTMVENQGVWNFGWILPKAFWQQPVAAHAHPDAGLPQLEDQQHAGGGDDRTDGDNITDPFLMHFIKNKGQRIGQV